MAEPDPHKRRLLADWERAHAGALGDVLLGGHLDAAAVGIVCESVIAAHEAITLEPAGRERISPVYTSVLHRHDVT
jgi:hypothetical protein